MIRSQQSADQNQGFFKPQEKVVELNNKDLKEAQKYSNGTDPNELVQQPRPSDFNARIITYFSGLKPYSDQLMVNTCQSTREELIPLQINKQKQSKKYLTLQQKYLNNPKYKPVYSKLENPKQFTSYIFSLDKFTDYNQKNYRKAEQHNLTGVRTQRNQIQEQFEFDSNFQSGNLLYAFKDNDETDIPTYDLIIQNDTNTKGYNQWFYFSVKKHIKSVHKSIRIRIVNFIKKHLMFQDGVRPVGMYSSKGQWQFIGRSTEYKKSFIKRYIEFNGSKITKNYYTLSFILDFHQTEITQISQKQAQTVHIALNYPYPYKRVISFIDKIIQQNNSTQVNIKKETLCHTISNNQIPYMTIVSMPTDKQIQHAIKTKQIQRQRLKQKLAKNFQEGQINDIQQQKQPQITKENIVTEIIQNKKKIIILGRQHPGETVGSFVLEGFVDNLMKGIKQNNSRQNNLKLLKQYSIYVFPMLNVDGVIYGNFRTNLAGFDLNRQWVQPNKWLHPEVFYLKKFISELKNIQFVLDFHGHSRKLNSFIYACNNPVPILLENQDQSNYPNISIFRLYPYILSKQCQLFSIKDCTYTISRDKIKTARINTFRNLKYNPYIFTLQTGFFGYTKADKKIRYQIQDFYTIGKGALQSLKTILLKPKKVKEILKQVQAKGYIFDMWSYENKQDPGSQSNPSEDQLNAFQIKTKVFSNQNMKQKNQNIKQVQPKKQYQFIRKSKPRKQKKRKQQKRNENDAKSQRIIFKSEDDELKILQQKIARQKQEQKQAKTSKKQKRRILKIQYLPEKKKTNNEQHFNVVIVKEAMIKKPQIHLPEPNYRQRNIKQSNKVTGQQFKSSSNLLGTGISYFKNKNKKMFQSALRTNPATIQMFASDYGRKDVRIQSFSQAQSYEQSQNVVQKLNNPNNFLKDNKIKDFFYKLNKNNKSDYSKASHRERVYVIRQNKIVRVVNNVTKSKSLSQKVILQNELKNRQQSLKQCQQLMSSDNKGLIEEIKEQIIEQNKKKKRIYLQPIDY